MWISYPAGASMDPWKWRLLRYAPPFVTDSLKRLHYPLLLSRPSTFNEPEMAVLTRLVQPGDFVVDIGANFGLYTVFLANLVGRQGRVLAVEPVPVTCGILRSNVRSLRLRNVEVRQLALSDSSGAARMVVPSYASGGRNYYMAHLQVTGRANPGGWVCNVQTATLDEVLAGRSERVAFIKCDAEGHELHCLRGAVSLLREQRPAWLVEIVGDPERNGSPAAEFMRHMDEAGYEVWFWANGHLRRRRPGRPGLNYFFLTSEQRRRLVTEEEGKARA